MCCISVVRRGDFLLCALPCVWPWLCRVVAGYEDMVVVVKALGRCTMLMLRQAVCRSHDPVECVCIGVLQLPRPVTVP